MVPTTSRFLRSLCHWMPLKRERISLIFDKVIFDLQGHGGCWRPKTPLRGQKMHEGVDLTKKCLIKNVQQPQKPFSGFNQIWATTSGKKVMIFEATKVSPVVLSAQSVCKVPGNPRSEAGVFSISKKKKALFGTYLILGGQRKLCILVLVHTLWSLCPKGLFYLIYLRFWCIIYFKNKGNFLFTDDSLMEWNREPMKSYFKDLWGKFAGWTIETVQDFLIKPLMHL